MGLLSPARRLGSQITPPPSLSSPLRSSTPSSPTYPEVLSPTRPAPVSPMDPEPGDYFWLWYTLAPYLGNIAGGADWHTTVAKICQKWGSPFGTAASEFSSQNQRHTAVVCLFPEPLNWTGWIK